MPLDYVTPSRHRRSVIGKGAGSIGQCPGLAYYRCCRTWYRTAACMRLSPNRRYPPYIDTSTHRNKPKTPMANPPTQLVGGVPITPMPRISLSPLLVEAPRNRLISRRPQCAILLACSAATSFGFHSRSVESSTIGGFYSAQRWSVLSPLVPPLDCGRSYCSTYTPPFRCLPMSPQVAVRKFARHQAGGQV